MLQPLENFVKQINKQTKTHMKRLERKIKPCTHYLFLLSAMNKALVSVFHFDCVNYGQERNVLFSSLLSTIGNFPRMPNDIANK